MKKPTYKQGNSVVFRLHPLSPLAKKFKYHAYYGEISKVRENLDVSKSNKKRIVYVIDFTDPDGQESKVEKFGYNILGLSFLGLDLSAPIDKIKEDILINTLTTYRKGVRGNCLSTTHKLETKFFIKVVARLMRRYKSLRTEMDREFTKFTISINDEVN